MVGKEATYAVYNFHEEEKKEGENHQKYQAEEEAPSDWVYLKEEKKKVEKQVEPPKEIHIRFGLHPNIQQLTEEIILPRDKIIRQGMLQKKS